MELGGSLPEVTEADDGKVLTVVDGQWNKAESGGDKGYECTEDWATLTDENIRGVLLPDAVYPSSDLPYSDAITEDIIKVTLDNIEYECNRIVFGNVSGYGGVGETDVDLTEYPFAIVFVGGRLPGTIYLETAGVHSLKIETVEKSVITTPCFKKAVKSVVNIPNIAIIYSSQLGTPSVDGVSRNNIAYTYCNDGSRDNEDMYLWDGMDSYNGEPIIYVLEDEPGNSFYFVSSFEQLELCAYDREEDATGRNLGLKERTKVLRLNGADGRKTLVSPNTQFYKYYLK